MTTHKSKPDRETDLYPAVRDYLVAQGYTVRAEVRDCDVTASKGNELIVIELKLQFSLDLLIQATRRQQITDSVYVAIPRPARMGPRSRWPGIKRLARRLELGLILVDFAETPPALRLVCHPRPAERRRSGDKRRAVIREMTGRAEDYNVGGSTGVKRMTAWRERAIHIACCLEALGPLSPRQLRALGTGPRTLSVLASELSYDWFRRVSRGVYELTGKGREELASWPATARFRKALEGVAPPP